MASGSQNMTTYNARTVTGSSSAASPAGALLLSGAGRASDATGDTWIFLDSAGGTSTPWGIKHDQANNKIQIFGAGTNSIWTEMDTGNTYIGGKLGIGYDPETSENLYKLYVNGTSLYTGRLYGNTDNGLEVQSLNTGNWKEGIRIYNASDNYSVLCLCNNDLSDLLSLVHSGSAHSYYIDIENDGTYSKIDIPSKHSGTMALTDGYGASGTWGISITGSARYIQSPDTRSTNPAPSTFNATNGVSFDFKQGSVIGLTSANYSGVMSYRPYASGTDWSGGNAHQIAFNNAGLYWRQGGSSWGNWTQIVTNSGTWDISITGNAATASKVGEATSWLYFNHSNEVNFGGTNTSADIYFGYRATDSRPKPTTFHFGTDSATVKAATFNACNGYLISTCHSNTVQIGSQNTGFCHITSSANVPFWFNRQVIIDGNLMPYTSNTRAFGNASSEWATGAIRAVYARHYDSSIGYTGDQNIYFGYNRGLCHYFYTCNNGSSRAQRAYIDTQGVHNAVWNDFAEYRKSNCTEGGRVVVDDGSGTMNLCNERLAKGARIISDTFGCSVGYSIEQNTPIGVGGRVLAYPYQSKEHYSVGDAVCAAPNGTIDLMTREEIINYPDRIIGIVSEIPTYEIWSQQASEDSTSVEIKVNGRIWIYVR